MLIIRNRSKSLTAQPTSDPTRPTSKTSVTYLEVAKATKLVFILSFNIPLALYYDKKNQDEEEMCPCVFDQIYTQTLNSILTVHLLAVGLCTLALFSKKVVFFAL